MHIDLALAVGKNAIDAMALLPLASVLMTDLLTPDDIERLARAQGKTLKQVCIEADIAQSTFSRWKNGHTEPTLDVYRRVRDVVAPVRHDDAPQPQEAA